MQVFCICLLFALLTNAANSNGLQNEAVSAKCKSVYHQITSIIDWPIRINCSSMIGQGFPVNSTSCSSPGQVKRVASVNTSFASIFQLTQLDSDDVCRAWNVSASSFLLNSSAWIDDVNRDVIARSDVVRVPLQFGDSVSLKCQAPTPPFEDVIYPPTPSYTAIWRITTLDPRYNSTLLVKSALTSTQKPKRKSMKRGDTLPTYEIPIATFFRPGIYSCEVRSRKRRAYVIHYEVCVKQKKSQEPPILACPDTVRFVTGQKFVVSCHVLAGNDEIKANELEVKWNKKIARENEVTICLRTNDEKNISDDVSRIDCGWSGLKNKRLVCINYQVMDASDLDAQLHHSLQFNAYLTFKEAAVADEGAYRFYLRFRDDEIESPTIHLIRDNRKELKALMVWLFSVLGSIIFLLILSWCLWYNKIKILLLLRKHFGKFDKDDKEFVACLSYFVSDEVTSDEIEKTRTIVKWTRQTLSDLNYKFLDYQEHFQPGYLPETVISSIRKSQVLILVVTSAFINDNNSLFVTQQGYLSMIKNETKLIFILTSDAKKAMKLRHHEISLKNFPEAMQGSKVIKWEKTTRESRFKEKLKYSLPNICSSEKTQNYETKIAANRV